MFRQVRDASDQCSGEAWRLVWSVERPWQPAMATAQYVLPGRFPGQTKDHELDLNEYWETLVYISR